MKERKWPKFMTGSDNFADFITGKGVFVDKSLFIRDVINSPDTALLFTRMRRGAKSLNMSMLYHFLAEKVFGVQTARLFDHLAIAKEEKGLLLSEHQGKYQVVFLSLKEIEASDFKSAMKQLALKFSLLVGNFRYLLDSDSVDSSCRELLKKIHANSADYETLQLTLFLLTKALFEHHGKRVWVLIDEYDQPLNEAFLQNYYPEMRLFMSGIFSHCLKSNPYLQKGVLTGVLRVAKAGIFSKLNNITEYSIHSHEYSEYFGFTENDVIWLLELVSDQIQIDINEIRRWYNGYNIGGRMIYNPWSIMQCLAHRGKCEPYWIGTSNNGIIRDVLQKNYAAVRDNMLALVQRETVEVVINKGISYEEINVETEAIWSLLLFTGYITIDSILSTEGTYITCRIRLPNYEVTSNYLNMITEWIRHSPARDTYTHFLKSLVRGDIEAFQKSLQEYSLNTFSYFDTGGKNSEQAYHAFVLGLVAGLHRQYFIKSNKESGLGRFDILMIPHDKRRVGIILEFKSIDRKSTEAQISKSFEVGMQQIHAKKYVNELVVHGIENRLFVSITFGGKQLKILHQSQIGPYYEEAMEAFSSSSSGSEGNDSPLKTPNFNGYLLKTFGESFSRAIRRENVVGNLDGEDMHFDIFKTGGAGHCGFYSLPIPYDRHGVVELLLENANNEIVRSLTADEIMELTHSYLIPSTLTSRHTVFKEYTDFHRDIDESQVILLHGVIEEIDPNRELQIDRNFESVLHYLQHLPNSTQLHQTLIQKMIVFNHQYKAQLEQFRAKFSSVEVFSDFVRLYLGGQGHLSFSIAGQLNFSRQTSSLDAILLVMNPPIRLHIWQDHPQEINRLHLVYRGGPENGTVTHVHHQGGVDSHFELMAQSRAAESELLAEAEEELSGSGSEAERKLKRLKTVYSPSLWLNPSSAVEPSEPESQHMDIDNDDILDGPK